MAIKKLVRLSYQFLPHWMFKLKQLPWRLFLLLVLLFLLSGCARHEMKIMEATAYCGCSKCCDWERGDWRYLKLDFWNKYVSQGDQDGKNYDGLTASGEKPQQVSPGLFSADSAKHPWKIPFRAVAPWLWFAEDGTIAADTRFYPFGTRMYVPGYGWGTVSDRGGAIKGPDRIDLFFKSHQDALVWGRRRVKVRIER